MANLASIRCGFYRIPLPVVLSDSTHGEMRAFELNTVRLTDAEGAEGVGYTYTAGRNGAAVHAILEREIAELFGGEVAVQRKRRPEGRVSVHLSRPPLVRLSRAAVCGDGLVAHRCP
jgi:L-alanine-DL-glutamate epimerase-like enolase superfamily enzyme